MEVNVACGKSLKSGVVWTGLDVENIKKDVHLFCLREYV